ncbi:MAG: hypothetical protein RMY64_29280 [Nostoc sp. DedQUE08]|uniref:tetratricopeptide repeat protein n=1 Tax=Nostoc sp. DedQUE08 TaxID=3075393 RepID=UPI002AD38FE7|nr:hypothetical protein [Nostoc sp. DedQUE08]MDZ8069654.1 hypothetical protein [Nostoc sp. DedQUE08]
MSQKKLPQRNNTQQRGQSNKNLLQIGRDFVLHINGGFFVVLITFFVLFGIGILSKVSFYIDSSQCNEKLTDPRKEPEQVKRVLKSCKEALNKEPNNTNILKRAAKASLVTWNPDWDSAQKQEVFNEIKNNFDIAYKQDTVDVQAAFYKDFVQDFKDIVLSQNPKCQPTEERYSRALELYSKKDNILEEDFSILFELSHFLINRDREYQRAIILLNKIPKTNSEFYKDVLLTKAIARLSQQNMILAKELFIEALDVDKAIGNIGKKESYKIKYHLASTYANLAIEDITNRSNYLKKAIELYNEITPQDIASNFYYAWRNKSFVLYLKGEYSKAVTAFDTALSFAAVNELDFKNKPFLKKYREKANEYSEKNQFRNEDNNIQLLELERDLKTLGIFTSYFITHESNKDPFFNVEHDKFYQCRT